jgi:hypothetical protein
MSDAEQYQKESQLWLWVSQNFTPRVKDACSAFPHSSRSSIASLLDFALTTENSPLGHRHM